MELKRAAAGTAILLSLLGTGCASATSGSPSSTLARVALSSGDLPTGLSRCGQSSGRYPNASSHYVDASADGEVWRAAGTAGASDAWIEIYAQNASDCAAYHTASDPVGRSGELVQNVVLDYGDPGTAHRAFMNGQFVPAEPSGFMGQQAAPLYGTVARGTGTGLGEDAYVDWGTVGTYSFSHSAWANGRYIVTLFAEKMSADAAHSAALAINARIPVASAQPTSNPGTSMPCKGTLHGGSGSISGDQLMYSGSGVPPLKIYAIQVGGGGYCYVGTASNQRTYTIVGLPPGQYKVVAYHITSQGTLKGGYTKAVPCGLAASCNDHSLIAVSVAEGQAVTGINPNDYYTPDLPPPPQ